MGLLTNEELEKMQIKFVAINKDDGGFIVDGKTYPGIEGQLLGFSTHTYEFKSRQQTKFDIFLYDDYYYQVQFGKYSWVTFTLLNQLMSIPQEDFARLGKLRIIIKNKNDNLNVYTKWNGRNLPWKYTYQELGLLDISPEEKEKKRNNIIDRWINYITEAFPFDPTILSLASITAHRDFDDDILGKEEDPF